MLKGMKTRDIKFILFSVHGYRSSLISTYQAKRFMFHVVIKLF